MSDLVAILFFFFLLFFITKDLMTSLMGAFAIYLWVGVVELKDYPVLNKILVISLVTYNIIFIAGLISFYFQDPIFLNTSFAFSFWIILGLGFLLFGRKYIIVWRFMSPAYLTLFLYVIAWLAVIFINEYTPIEFIQNTPLNLTQINLSHLIFNIYFILIIVNWFIYFISGPLLDKMLGIKKIRNNDEVLDLVTEVKNQIGIKSKVKIGFGKYPILNAMAYGSVFDKRIAIIAPDIDKIPQDELKGIVAHELSHTKGKHTFILTVITSLDLILRMILGLPATYYDYTFGNPRISLLGFIILNLSIYLILYIFVRILEGRADLMSKNAGYAKHLAKALYNLESFYAVGREIGLNTMLLCDEKITEDNQLIDYMETAQYLNSSLIKPSKASLLANFLNSHPPTYFRIAAILDNELKPGKEAILPLIVLFNKKQEKYSQKFEKARQRFKKIANEKFKTFFNITEISSFVRNMGKKKDYKLDINHSFLFKNKINKTMIFGELIDIEFSDDITESDKFVIKNIINGEEDLLNSPLYSRYQVDLNKTYLIDNSKLLTLKRIEFKDENKEAFYVFMNENNEELRKSVKKFKLPNPIEDIENLENKDVLLKEKGNLRLCKCTNVFTDNHLENYQIELINNNQMNELEKHSFRLKDIVINPRKIYVSVKKRKKDLTFTVQILDWIIREGIRTTVYLKKPVNNIERGYFKKIEVNSKKKSMNNKFVDKEGEFRIIMENIFNTKKEISSNIIEAISFEFDTATIQKKSDISVFSKIGYRILKRLKPKEIIYV